MVKSIQAVTCLREGESCQSNWFSLLPLFIWVGWVKTNAFLACYTLTNVHTFTPGCCPVQPQRGLSASLKGTGGKWCPFISLSHRDLPLSSWTKREAKFVGWLTLWKEMCNIWAWAWSYLKKIPNFLYWRSEAHISLPVYRHKHAFYPLSSHQTAYFCAECCSLCQLLYCTFILCYSLGEVCSAPPPASLQRLHQLSSHNF